MKRIGFLCCSHIFFLSLVIFNSQAQSIPAAIGEKIYIHFDRDWYGAGETMWFKIYLFDRRFPSALSEEVFLQLEDHEGKVIESKRLLVNGATASGSITLKETLTSGYYILKATGDAFPDPAFVYQKTILIAGEKIHPLPFNDSLYVNFFPESGHLVDRIRTQVAFKAVDASGSPVDVNGAIKTDSGEIVTRFKSLHDGMGRMSFTPRRGDKLTAEIDYKGKKYRYRLPEAMSFGVNMKISDADSGKIFEITRSKLNSIYFDTVRLVVKLNADTVFESLIPFGYEQAVKSLLKTANLPTGILHFILLSKFDAPLAERLAFVDNGEYRAKAELRPIRDSARAGHHSLKIIFADTIQKSLSYAVAASQPSERTDRDNICARFLLTSDLRGSIFDAAYYFEKDSIDRKPALDNLMLTHGWTRYNWKANNPYVKEGKAESKSHELLVLSGTVREKATQKPLGEGLLHLQIIGSDSSFQAVDVPVKEGGKFRVNSLVFFGTASVYHSYSTPSGKSMPVSILFDQPGEVPVFQTSQQTAMVSDDSKKEMAEQAWSWPNPALPGFEEKFKQLDTVYLKTRTRRIADRTNEKYAGTLFRSSGKLVLDNISNPYNDRTMSVIDYILNNIRSVDIYRDEGILVNRKNFSLQSQRNWKVELFLDENVASIAAARSITMDQVALIKFYEAGFIGVGSQAPGGAVAVYTKKYEDMDKESSGEIASQFRFEGYAITKEFYQPPLKDPYQQRSPADDRATLVWKTQVLSGIQAKEVNIDFVNNDAVKKLVFVLQGFDARGKLVDLRYRF